MTLSAFRTTTVADSEIKKTAGTRRSRLWLIGLFAVATPFLAGLFALRKAGQWLIVQDPLAPADVIVVLSGGMPYRAMEAARLYKAVSYTHLTLPTSDLV